MFQDRAGSSSGFLRWRVLQLNLWKCLKVLQTLLHCRPGTWGRFWKQSDWLENVFGREQLWRVWNRRPNTINRWVCTVEVCSPVWSKHIWTSEDTAAPETPLNLGPCLSISSSHLINFSSTALQEDPKELSIKPRDIISTVFGVEKPRAWCCIYTFQKSGLMGIQVPIWFKTQSLLCFFFFILIFIYQEVPLSQYKDTKNKISPIVLIGKIWKDSMNTR